MSNEKILSYNDVVLRRSDLDILNGPYFLNDRIIEFYFSYLASSISSEDVILVPPSICFWITYCPDHETLKDFVEPLKLPEKNLIIFSVNNNDDVTLAEGGTHWSLLAYERNSNLFVHHDSFAGSNHWYSKRLYKAIFGFVGSSDLASNVRYVECEITPQQINGYDCGLFVTAIAKSICYWYKFGGGGGESRDRTELWFQALKDQVNPSMVADMRREILKLIRDLMSEKRKDS